MHLASPVLRGLLVLIPFGAVYLSITHLLGLSGFLSSLLARFGLKRSLMVPEWMRLAKVLPQFPDRWSVAPQTKSTFRRTAQAQPAPSWRTAARGASPNCSYPAAFSFVLITFIALQS